MMKPLIPLSYYTDPKVFAGEQVGLFQNLWNFAGFTMDLDNHDDYICTEIGGKSVIVQNFHGELRAFHNVCSHRFSRIHQHPQGNGPLQCPYHGWVYNSEGIPVGIPHQSEFNNLTDATRESLRLEKWLLQTCGSFVFVKKQDDGISLKDFLRSTYDKLQEVSGAIGKKIDCNPMVVNANWKIVLENSMESYHIRSIHPKTFGKFSIAEHLNLFDEPHSAYNLKFSEKWASKQKKIETTIFSTRKIKVDGYYHHLVFPGLTLATTYGISFFIQAMYPISPLQTKLISYVFLAKLDEVKSDSEQSTIDVMSQSVTKFARTVYEEDNFICEQVQLGISSVDDRAGIFSREEQRLYEFHKNYVNLMNNSNR